MKIYTSKSKLQGEVTVPGSKSHTIRGLIFAGLCKGTSKLINPLISSDTLSCLNGIKSFGAKIVKDETKITIDGFYDSLSSNINLIDVGNSGTSLSLLTGIASLSDKEFTFDGDNSIRSRPMKPLLLSLKDLGANISSSDEGKCPFKIKGPIIGGKTRIDGISSQFLSSLLITSPLTKNGVEIEAYNLHEKPYVEMTLAWLKEQNIIFEEENLTYFKIPGGQKYSPFNKVIPSDFSTACFPLCASLITKSIITINGLDFNDTQGDKMVFEFLKRMGMDITVKGSKTILNPLKNELHGVELDLNATPDALPVLAVTACFLKGKTILKNVEQARIKECDRISAMVKELKKMGAKIEEMRDGLIIEGTPLNSSKVYGYHDHRIVMAFSLAGMGIKGKTEIDTAESVSITYPDFVKDMKKLGANIETD